MREELKYGYSNTAKDNKATHINIIYESGDPEYIAYEAMKWVNSLAETNHNRLMALAFEETLPEYPEAPNTIPSNLALELISNLFNEDVIVANKHKAIKDAFDTLSISYPEGFL